MESTGDNDENIAEAFITNESGITEVPNTESRLMSLITHCKDNPRYLFTIILLTILLIISFSLNIHYYHKQNMQKQSCISVESYQNITSPLKQIDPNDYNCSGKPVGNVTTNVETMLKLELWNEDLKIVVQLPTNFILHKFSYDKKREIVLCRKDRNHYYILCNKPYNDNCTIINENVNNTSSTTSIKESGDRMLTYVIPTKCINRKAVLEWIQAHKCMLPKPKN